ncbi:MAG: histidine phosphatase family protein [Planctomycetota bacterium]
MAKPRFINLIVIRSGECDWDRESRLVGRADLPLSGDGLERVAVEATALDGVSLSSILHPPEQCCRATAEAYASVTGARCRSVADLVDVDLGLWEGLRRDELVEKFPKAFGRWIEDPAEVAVPEGEPMLDAQTRLVAAFAKACEKLRNTDPGVGLVLRPMAYGLLRCWLSGQPASELWNVANEPGFAWYEVPRDRLREARLGVPTGG